MPTTSSLRWRVTQTGICDVLTHGQRQSTTSAPGDPKYQTQPVTRLCTASPCISTVSLAAGCLLLHATRKGLDQCMLQCMQYALVTASYTRGTTLSVPSLTWSKPWIQCPPQREQRCARWEQSAQAPPSCHHTWHRTSPSAAMHSSGRVGSKLLDLIFCNRSNKSSSSSSSPSIKHRPSRVQTVPATPAVSLVCGVAAFNA
jgi:hypothetical protein